MPPSAGLWARATSDGACVNVLLANFVAAGAPARTVQVILNGALPRCHGQRLTTLATLDTSSSSLANAKVVQLDTQRSVAVPRAVRAATRFVRRQDVLLSASACA